MTLKSTEAFNAASAPYKRDGHDKWMVLHGVLMLGMLLPMIATAAPLGTATLGDAVVQSLHMVSGMISGITDHFDVLADLVSNSLNGDFAAHTFDSGMMHGEVTHSGVEMMDHTAHMGHGGG